jgi:hypothetical protein
MRCPTDIFLLITVVPEMNAEISPLSANPAVVLPAPARSMPHLGADDQQQRREQLHYKETQLRAATAVRQMRLDALLATVYAADRQTAQSGAESTGQQP